MDQLDLDHHCPRSPRFCPSLGCTRHLPCNDPVFWCFDLSRVSARGAYWRPEFKTEYREAGAACAELAVDLLDLCRDTGEVHLLLEAESGSAEQFTWNQVLVWQISTKKKLLSIKKIYRPLA